jgi:hypothetical protein
MRNSFFEMAQSGGQGAARVTQLRQELAAPPAGCWRRLSSGCAAHPFRVLAALLGMQAVLLAYSAYVHSPTLNEPAHLAAGISHWQLGRFDLYKVNPPLVRMVAALPALAAGTTTDWTGFFEAPGARPEFAIGDALIAANGERSFFLCMLARWACIPFSLLGGLVCFLWGRDLYGPRAGLLAASLWCFEPNVLGHGALITSDAAAAALGLAACYTFWRWLRRPTWDGMLLTGTVLGIAELTKTTLILFYPLWPLLWLAYRWPERGTLRLSDWCREGAMLVARMVVALYIVNIGYACEGSLTPLREFHFVSHALNGMEPGASGNRFESSWLGRIPVPLPKSYVEGLDTQRRDFEDFGKPSYLRGRWQATGWWYYYLYALAIKVPLGIWGLGIWASVGRFVRRPAGVSRRDELVLLFTPLLILAVASSQCGFSDHLRYVLPIFPFAFVWISQIAAPSAVRSFDIGAHRGGARAGRLALAVLLAWGVGSSLRTFPHSLSYFNELAGGPAGGHAHLLGSNIDWGQDLRYLKWWLERRADQDSVYLAYEGGVAPTAVGITCQTPPSVPDEQALAGLAPGWYAISISHVRGMPWMRRALDQPGAPLEVRSFAGFLKKTPVGRFGYSIYLYHVPDESGPSETSDKRLLTADEFEREAVF